MHTIEKDLLKFLPAKKFGLDEKIVSEWVQQYQSDGIGAIRPKTSKTKYNADFKYNVKALMLAEELRPSQTAIKLHISSPALISHWIGLNPVVIRS